MIEVNKNYRWGDKIVLVTETDSLVGLADVLWYESKNNPHATAKVLFEDLTPMDVLNDNLHKLERKMTGPEDNPNELSPAEAVDDFMDELPGEFDENDLEGWLYTVQGDNWGSRADNGTLQTWSGPQAEVTEQPGEFFLDDVLNVNPEIGKEIADYIRAKLGMPDGYRIEVTINRA